MAGDLWREPNFMRLWTAQTFSAFGSRITRTALPIIAVATLGVPEGMMGVMAAAQFAPGVLIAMFAGGFIDRRSKRRILIGADLARAALVASLPIAWWFGALSLMQLALVGAGVGAATALFMITDNAYLPALINRAHLEEGNAKLETTDAIAEIAGPAAAGSLIAALGAPLAVVVDALSYLWSALWLVQIREPQPSNLTATVDPATGPRKLPRPPALADLRFGLRTIFDHPQVRWLVLAHMVWSISGGFFMTLYSMYCLRGFALIDRDVRHRHCLWRYRRLTRRTAIARPQTPIWHWPDPGCGIKPVAARRHLDAFGRHYPHI